MSYIQKNWKTVSMGTLMIISAVVTIVWPNLATKIITAATAIITGIGFMVTGDASASVQSGDTITTTANSAPHVVTKVDPAAK